MVTQPLRAASLLLLGLVGTGCALLVSFDGYELAASGPRRPVSGTVDGLDGDATTISLNGGPRWMVLGRRR